MALLVNLDPSTNQKASELNAALAQIRDGLAVLEKYNGMRAEAIGAGPGVMAAVFGVSNNAEAQALSDRWGALLAAYEDSENAEFAKLRDLLNATIAS